MCLVPNDARRLADTVEARDQAEDKIECCAEMLVAKGLEEALELFYAVRIQDGSGLSWKSLRRLHQTVGNLQNTGVVAVQG